MPTPQRYYPPVSDLVNVSAIPGDFQAIESLAQDAVDALLKKVFYKDLVIDAQANSDTRYYSLIILSKSLRLQIFGSGLNLVFFRGASSSLSEFPLTFTFKWPIRKYISNFKAQGFSYAPEAFIDVLFSIAKINNESDFLSEIVSILLDDGDDTYLDFISTLKSLMSNYSNGDSAVDAEIQNIIAKIDDLKDEVYLLATNTNLYQLIDIFNNYTSFSGINAAVNSIKTSQETLFNDHNIYVNFKRDGLIAAVASYPSSGEKIPKLVETFRKFFNNISLRQLFDFLLPQLSISLSGINMALEFPRSILLPLVETSPDVWEVDDTETGNPPEKVKTGINFTTGQIKYDTLTGFNIEIDNNVQVDLPRCRIAGTNLDIEFIDVKLDLSRKTNIPEATADGRPVDFMGVYVQDATIGFPAFWNHDDDTSTGEIKGRNLLIGTGGISGILALEAKTSGDPSPLLELKFGTNFAVSLDTFSLTFHQNSITNAHILGTLTLPGFKQGQDEAKIPIHASIEKDGDFKISANVSDLLDPISIPEILDIYIINLEVAKDNGKFYAAITSDVDFTVEVPNISTDFPKRLPMKIKVWENGKIEFDKGTLILPKAIKLEIGPVKLAVTALHFGSAELQFEGNLRQYNYIGFDGALNINPGGVGVRGNGVKLYYTTDNDPENEKNPHRFIRVDGIGIDLMIPSSATSPADAELFLKGYLSVKNKPQGESGPPTTEYAGSIEFSINKAEIRGAGGMRFNPSIPSFLIDIGIEFSSPIVLGNTGLGVYGIRGLMAKGYRLDKTEEETWWKFYKRPQEGINFEKFYQDKGFSLGLGAIIATSPDAGISYSAKLLMMLGLPDVFLLTGQGTVMDKRVSFLDPDPPFSAMLAVSKQSIEAGFGVNYKMPKPGGAVLSVTGDIQMAYFYKNSSAWYINVGRDFPEEQRVKAVALTIMEAYAYLMISAQGIKFGAGRKFDFNKDYKVVAMAASVYQNLFAKVSFKPTQVGGGIDMGGLAYFSVLKFKLGLSIHAHLGADSFKPFKIAGGVKVALTLPKPIKSKEVNVEFVWVFDQDRPTAPFKPIEQIDNAIPVKAINMLTGEDYNVNYTPASLPANITWIDKTIPLDSYIDVDFVYSVKTELVEGSARIFGEVTSPDFTPSIPPERGLSEPVKHELKLKNVLIKAWNGSAWVEYNVYEGVSAIRNIPAVEEALNSNANYLKEFPQGFWQLKTPNKNSHIRIMGQNMFSYLNSTREGAVKLEYLGFKGGVVLCEEDKIQPTCINWEDVAVDTEYTSNALINHKGITIKVINADGSVKTYSAYSLTKGLNFTTAEGIEIYFSEPQGLVKPKATIFSPNKLVVEYYKEVLEGYDVNNNPVFNYLKIRTDSIEEADLGTYAGYDDADEPVVKIKISVDRIDQANIHPNHTGDLIIGHANYNSSLLYNSAFNGQVDDVNIIGRALTALEIENLRKKDNTGPNLIGQWKLDGNANDSSGNGFNGMLIPNAGQNPIAAPGKTGTANTSYYFSGSTKGIYQGNHIKINHNSKLAVGRENFTLSAWIKLPNYDITKGGAFNTHSFIISKTNASYGGYYIMIGRTNYGNSSHEAVGFMYGEDLYSSSLYYSVENMISFPYTGNKLYDGKWHFVAVTIDYDNLACTIYFDDFKNVKQISPAPGQSQQNNNAYLHQLCLLTEKQSKYNQNIPPQSKLTAENTQMADGLTKLFQPVWRPNTNYAIEITTSDNVDGGGEAENKFTVGFKTAGPVGYFHTLDSRYTSLAQDEKDRYQLARLQHYINYNRSFPNAEGKLLNNKPIFYKQPSLHLYFNFPYINAMYSQWQTYNGVPVSEYTLELYVADPLNEQQGTNALQPSWVPGKLVIETEDVRMLNNLIANGPNCSGLSGPLERLAYNARYVLPDLRPNSLYTAIYHAVNGTTKENVHQHVFVTSKYGTFKEQIESYLLGDNSTAVYIKSYDFTTGEITKATDIVTKNVNQDVELVKKFADGYDRLIDGVLNKITPMQAPTTTEFNCIKNSNNQKTIGLLIRNPEPIFNPQLPDSDLLNSIGVVNNLQGGGTENNYEFVFSKDRSAVFITKGTLEIPAGVLDITMKYLEYNGVDYTLKSPQSENEITVGITIS